MKGKGDSNSHTISHILWKINFKTQIFLNCLLGKERKGKERKGKEGKERGDSNSHTIPKALW
jgi:hypothetical protein